MNNEPTPETTPDQSELDVQNSGTSEDQSTPDEVPADEEHSEVDHEDPSTTPEEPDDSPKVESAEPSEELTPTADDTSAPTVEPTNDTAQVAESEVPAEPVPEPPPPNNKKWYIVKVTSGREDSIKASIERRVKIEGLEPFFGQVHIPVEKVIEVKKVKEKKNGETVTKERRVTKDRKKFPGYIMAEVEFNDQILYLFRETNGVADFVGGASANKPPSPMEELDVKRMLGDLPAGEAEASTTTGRKKTKTVVKLDFDKGDKVRIREGVFANTVGEVKSIVFPKESGEPPQVTVVVEVIGRPIDVTLEYWQVDKV